MNFKLIILFFLIQGLIGQDSLQDRSVISKMVLVPGNDRVNGFYMDKYEVTNAEFFEFVKATGYVTEAEKIGGIKIYVGLGKWKMLEGETWRTSRYLKKQGIIVDRGNDLQFANQPVFNLAANDILAYAKWVGKRVPTYEEWVHAAKAAQDDYAYKYPGSNKIREVAWYEKTSNEYLPENVGTKKPNELGIYDLAGNVMELVLKDKNKPNEFWIVGGHLASSAEECEIGKKVNFPVELDLAFDSLGIRLVKDIQ
jgi:formylglycine-generating enzyme